MELPKLLFKPKKVWPPDFKSMSPQEQLRLEKKYKRRAALATARPRWDKFIRLAQLFSVTFVAIYGVLFMETKDEHNPFLSIRKRFWEFVGSMSTNDRPVRRTLSDHVDNPPASK
ncbi:hypothetical protein DL546_005550 [Coniochaeta pulveracea]|uniref:Uncharacterized protein n=1 Tax=Coniochaeta pulveracea TaxID=177199 RepID=A0A420YA46_9PEZI|nr:hypothetical protein DL546_005550 [Coniochaeta pulveracea]